MKLIDRRHVLVDIDHTLSNAFWRDPMIGGPWDEYHAASIQDAPILEMIAMANALRQSGFFLTGLTARPAKWRNLTMTWLLRHNCELDELLMRPDDAFHPAPELKLKLALERFPNIKNEVAFIMDDREDVIAAFRGLGITALQVHGRQQ